MFHWVSAASSIVWKFPCPHSPQAEVVLVKQWQLQAIFLCKWKAISVLLELCFVDEGSGILKGTSCSGQWHSYGEIQPEGPGPCGGRVTWWFLCPSAWHGGGTAWNWSGRPEQMDSSWVNLEAITIHGKFTRTALTKCWRVFWHKAHRPLSFCFSILCQMCHNIFHRLFISHFKKMDARFRLLSKQRMWGREYLNCRMIAEGRKEKHIEKAKHSRAGWLSVINLVRYTCALRQSPVSCTYCWVHEKNGVNTLLLSS